MMLGKRGRPPMRRTTSMTEFTLDFTGGDDTRTQDAERVHVHVLRRNSAEFRGISNPDFLRVCGLCKRRLIPGRDIYMYRGDTGFCSVECREHEMTQDHKYSSHFSLPSNNTPLKLNLNVAAGPRPSVSSSSATTAAV